MTYFSISCSLRPAWVSPLSAASGRRLRTTRARSAWDRTMLPSTDWPPSLRATSWTIATDMERSLKATARCHRDRRQLAEKQEMIGRGGMPCPVASMGIGAAVASETVNSAADSGSLWRRWEPHIHAPGTVLNDQFRGADAWERYLAALEGRLPAIRALGTTDYYCLDTYERVCAEKVKGRLPDCDLIFPHIELRLKLVTV